MSLTQSNTITDSQTTIKVDVLPDDIRQQLVERGLLAEPKTYSVTAGRMTINVEQLNYHRNGGSGEPFFAVRFSYIENGERHTMLGIVFLPEMSLNEDGERDFDALATEFHNPQVAVLDLNRLPNVGFGNEWRGDRFAPALYEAIRRNHASLWCTNAECSKARVMRGLPWCEHTEEVQA
jgi:hypothetical protein